jgi:glycosyltransferase involved in cell wall biosynthesis
MRLLYFSRDYTTHDHRFLSALAKTEHRVSYLRLERRGHELEERALPPEIEIVQWCGGKTAARWQDGVRLLGELKKTLRRVKPDAVLAGPIQRSAFLAALAGFRPLVSMSWGYDLLQDASRNVAWSWATRFTLKRSAALVGDCNTIRRLAVSYGMPDERIVTFPWGIDLEHFAPGDRGRRSEAESAGAEMPFTVLSMRSWEPIYGVEVIARAFVKAAGEHPELRLAMLGNGSQAGLLRRILATGGLSNASDYPHVLFPGQINYADLPRYYRSADLYVSASHSDGSSISLLEAMACGCPVLVSDIPGNREWVRQGENGWLFPDGDAQALERAMLQAVEQRECLPEMGRAARRTAEQRADWKLNFPQIERAFEIAKNSGNS